MRRVKTNTVSYDASQAHLFEQLLMLCYREKSYLLRNLIPYVPDVHPDISAMQTTTIGIVMLGSIAFEVAVVYYGRLLIVHLSRSRTFTFSHSYSKLNKVRCEKGKY